MSVSASPAPHSGETAPNAPNPLPASGAANVALCNFTSQSVTFKVFGVQAGKAVTKEISVPVFSYLWSTGWAAGQDQTLTVSTPYNTKTFTPFVTSDLVAVFQS